MTDEGRGRPNAGSPGGRADLPVYVLGFAPARGRLHLEPCEPLDGYALKEGRLRPAAPPRFRRYSGSKLLDLLDTTWAVLEVVSPRVLQALEGAGATGYRPVPVVIERDGGAVEGYAVLSVVGRSGALDWAAARLETRPPPVPQGQPVTMRVGPRIDPAAWDGSDVFLPGDSLVACVTQKVKDALDAAGVTGVHLTPLAEYEGEVDY